MPDCPSCGHAVKVVGDTTQHYEPVGCLQVVDDHEVCNDLLRSAEKRERTWEQRARRLAERLAKRDSTAPILAETWCEELLAELDA